MLPCGAALILDELRVPRRAQHGGPTSFSDQHMRMVPESGAGDDRSAWLTRHLLIAEGRLSDARQIEHEVHRVD
jgi:hypothetical protein